MKLNPQEIGKILTDHLDGITTEEFMANVKEFCPYLFEKDDLEDRPSDANTIRKGHRHRIMEVDRIIMTPIHRK